MKTDWQRLASIGICLTLGIVFLFLLGKYLAAIFLPFLIAWIMAFFTNLISNGVCARFKLPKKLCTSVVLVLLFLLIGWGLVFGVNRFLTEMENFVSRLTLNGDTIYKNISDIAEKFDNIGSHIPLISEMKKHEQLVGAGEQLDQMLSSFLKGLATDLGALITSFAAGAVKALPSIILFLIISIIASFYFALDFEAINGWVYRVLPPSMQAKIPRIKAHTKSLAARYLKAYSILMVLTFFELYVGLTVIGVDYAFLLALGISFLDILPVFGVGTVLLPWAIISFITHDFAFGVGLVILWAVVSVIRQIIEPRIVGGTIGLHPVVTLIGMYVGFRLFGIVGMFLSPAAIIAVKAYFTEKYTVSGNRTIDSAAKK